MFVPHVARKIARWLLDDHGVNTYDGLICFEKGFYVGKGKDKVLVTKAMFAPQAQDEPEASDVLGLSDANKTNTKKGAAAK